MTISKRVKQVYISFLITAFLLCISILLGSLSGKIEWVSFTLSALSLLLTVIAVIYSTMEFVITKEPSDLWKLGFLGLFGLAGLIPGLGFGFFGLFGLFAFFGTREYF